MSVHIASRATARRVGFDGSAEIVWDDLRIPGTQVLRGVSAPDIVPFLGAGGLYLPGFDGGATLEQVFFTVQLPHGYALGTDISPHVHWSPSTAAAGNVKWQLEYTWADIGATYGASTTIDVTDAASGTAWDHQLAGFADISGVSSMLVCRLFRDPGDAADTYGADAILKEIDFHYQIDTIGSLQETSKV